MPVLEEHLLLLLLLLLFFFREALLRDFFYRHFGAGRSPRNLTAMTVLILPLVTRLNPHASSPLCHYRKLYVYVLQTC